MSDLRAARAEALRQGATPVALLEAVIAGLKVTQEGESVIDAEVFFSELIIDLELALTKLERRNN